MTTMNVKNNSTLLPTHATQPGLADMPPEILQKILGPVARQLRETERPNFAALSKDFAQVVATMRLEELHDDVARRGHFLPQSTSLFPERLPTAAELMRRGCKSPSHINFPRIRAWAKKHFPEDKPGPLGRLYEEASQLFWRETDEKFAALITNRNEVQKINGTWLYRGNPIDPLPEIYAATQRLGSQEPLERLEYMGFARHVEFVRGDVPSRNHFKRETTFTTWPEGLTLSLENLRQHAIFWINPYHMEEACCGFIEYDDQLTLDMARNDKTKPLYQFVIENDHISSSGICFSEGIHPKMAPPEIVLCKGIQTQVKDNVMQVSLWVNSRVNLVYPPISKNVDGIYCCFPLGLDATQQKNAQELIASGYCQQLAEGWSHWVNKKWGVSI